jgi:hypothetical protein
MDAKKIISWHNVISLLVGGLITAGIWLYNTGKKSTVLEGRIFKDVNEKYEVVNHVKLAPTPAQLQISRLLDSINIKEEKEFREEVIKQMQQVINRVDHLDTLYLKTHDQVYQINQNFKN